jgi:hypothetical protein
MKRYYSMILKSIALLLLFSCATTQQAQRVKEGETINMGSYTVNVPPGDDWQIQIDKEREAVIFVKEKGKGMRVLGQLLGGNSIRRGTTLIQIFRNAIMDPSKWYLSEEEIADDYRNSEENIVSMGEDEKEEYKLEDVKKGITTVEGRRLYFLSYKATTGHWMGSLKGPSKAVEATLYLFFPPDFRYNHIFYGFLINESYLQGNLITVDLTIIYPVINSFRITTPPLVFPAGMNGEVLKAAASADILKIKDLINSGADANAKREDGWTPLMFVSAIGNKEIANLLIDKGANINEKNNQGQTPLFFAAHWGQAELVNILIEKGANINAQMADGRSVLTEAIDMNRVEIAKVLIVRGADVNLKSKNGRTALMAASIKNHPDVVRLLIEKGADVNAKSDEDTTALRLAVKLGNVEIVRLLKEAGAKD